VSLALLVPGAIDQLTGGYLFARHVADGLAARGNPLVVIELAGRYPNADVVARDACTVALAQLPDKARAVIDGLALAGFAACLPQEASRLRLVAWVHHPLADETGLSTEARAHFHAVETGLLPQFKGIICPSRCTADAVAAYGVDPTRIAVAPPGTRQPMRPRARAQQNETLRLLLVATVTPRKGHLVLIDALSRLHRTDWRLDCIGSTARDPDYVAAVRRAITTQNLDARIFLHEEIAPEKLAASYEAADLFVLPSFHEGYGMVLAEALAHGLPIIATRAGAIPETVTATAGILVAPGDPAALAAALANVLSDRVTLARLAQGAAMAGATLPDWPSAVARWQRDVERLLA
jgi:glycosyltransferase involved in cell wall biosynthesis